MHIVLPEWVFAQVAYYEKGFLGPDWPMFRDFKATSNSEKGRLAETRIGDRLGHTLRAVGARLEHPCKISSREQSRPPLEIER